MWLPDPLPAPGIPNLRVHHPTDPGERPNPAQSRQEQLETERSMLLSPQGLPDDIDLVIGHPRFTGDITQQLRGLPVAGDDPQGPRA